MSNQEARMSLNESLEAALDAEARGVSVNWKDMCFKVYNLASNYIEKLESNNESPVVGSDQSA